MGAGSDPNTYSWPTLHVSMHGGDQHQRNANADRLQFVAMSSAPDGQCRWVGVFKKSLTISNLDTEFPDYMRVVDSYAQPAILDFYRQRRAERADGALRERYKTWQGICDLAFKPTASTIKIFPHPPAEACTCTLPGCGHRKKETTLGACRHDIEAFLRASGKYSKAWLKQERVRWHPDQFSRRSEASQKAAFEKMATEMYMIIEELIAAEK